MTPEERKLFMQEVEDRLVELEVETEAEEWALRLEMLLDGEDPDE